MFIRRANDADIPAIEAIYDAIHSREEAGLTATGWVRGVYPTAATAREAVKKGSLYVLEEDGGKISASARLDRQQLPEYAQAAWAHQVPESEVLVMHTLVVAPERAGRGLGRSFVEFYEAHARSIGCSCLRMDTNVTNTAARAMYSRLGFREAGEVRCEFNGISGVTLVCLEKHLKQAAATIGCANSKPVW